MSKGNDKKTKASSAAPKGAVSNYKPRWPRTNLKPGPVSL